MLLFLCDFLGGCAIVLLIDIIVIMINHGLNLGDKK